MYTDDELKRRENLLVAAFTEANFANELKKIRIEMEDKLKEFITYLKEALSENQKIYENIESRIKGEDSFKEKIYRKDYIEKWDVSQNKQDNQNLIALHLPDLLGFRINCFFWQDEEKIYYLLQDYYQEGKLDGFKLNFNENCKQKNGHIINKVSGIYKEHYCFEIQIKSIMHNIWGEVEHKTVYKSREYDADIDSKKAITEEVFNILQASDKQLISLFSRKNDKRQLIYALFYEQTKAKISNLCRTEILAVHYRGFFRIFMDSQSINGITQYVAYTLLEKEYQKMQPSLNKQDTKNVAELKDLILSQFLEFNLRCIYNICGLLYNFTTFEDFITFLAQYLLSKYGLPEDETDGFDAFEDDEEKTDNLNDQILKILEDEIGGLKENGFVVPKSAT